MLLLVPENPANTLPQLPVERRDALFQRLGFADRLETLVEGWESVAGMLCRCWSVALDVRCGFGFCMILFIAGLSCFGFMCSGFGVFGVLGFFVF